MALGPTDEQRQLRSSVRAFFQARSSEADLRRLIDADQDYDRAVWSAMAGELGLSALAIPEDLGGAGFTAADLLVVFEEMGRALLCSPFFGCIALAANLLLSIDDEHARRTYLPRLASGSLLATVAVAESARRWDAASIGTQAAGDGPTRSITGEKMFVVDGMSAEVIFVLARTDSGPTILAVERGAPGLTVSAMTTIDPTRKQARVSLLNTPGQIIGADGQGAPAVTRMLGLACIALAAEQVGGAQRALEMSVDYAKLRTQFGRSIGGFQSIKHKCADMLVAVEAARAALRHAASVDEDDVYELALASSTAKAFCSQMFSQVADDNIHIHGGIGFTWEHPAHLFYKRARTSELILGSPTQHRDLLAYHLMSGAGAAR